MHVIAFVAYGLLAGCLTAAVGFVALKLCMVIGPPVLPCIDR